MDYGKVSVIVPIYKVEPYLDCCVQSIVDQTYENLEIILVDDGSPDNCPAMCDDWAAKDSRIRVIHKENGGFSSARNAGLDAATGDYIQFVDSDDWILPDMTAALVSCAVKENADVVRCGYCENVDGDMQEICTNSQTYCPEYNKLVIDIMNDGLMSGAVWNKLYKHSVLNGMRFRPGYSEDILFNYCVIQKKPKMVYMTGTYYVYRVNRASVTNSVFRPTAFSIIEVKKQIMGEQTDGQVQPYCLKGYLNSAMIVMNNMLSSGRCLEYYPGLRAEILKYKWTVWRSSLYGTRDKAKMLLLALSAKLYHKAMPKK